MSLAARAGSAGSRLPGGPASSYGPRSQSRARSPSLLRRDDRARLRAAQARAARPPRLLRRSPEGARRDPGRMNATRRSFGAARHRRFCPRRSSPKTFVTPVLYPVSSSSPVFRSTSTVCVDFIPAWGSRGRISVTTRNSLWDDGLSQPFDEILPKYQHPDDQNGPD